MTGAILFQFAVNIFEHMFGARPFAVQISQFAHIGVQRQMFDVLLAQVVLVVWLKKECLISCFFVDFKIINGFKLTNVLN